MSREPRGRQLVQSSTLKKLLKELGYGDFFRYRDTKYFKSASTKFRFEFEAKGYTLDYFCPTSSEARQCATEFCEGNDRGKSFWPSESHLPGVPCWPIDREKIIQALAHYFTLQAYHNYQMDLTLRRITDSTTNGSTSSATPAKKRKISVPSMPTDLRRPVREEKGPGQPVRPALDSNPKNPLDEDFRVKFENDCITEIKSLDPANDDGSGLKELNRQWLSTPNIPWPVHSLLDAHLKRLLLTHDYYDTDNKSHMHQLTKTLLHTTELQELVEISDTKRFIFRLSLRVKFHVSRFSRSGFVEHDASNELHKNEIFKKFWGRRESYWKPMVTTGTPTQTLEPARGFGADLVSLRPNTGSSMIAGRLGVITTNTSKVCTNTANNTIVSLGKPEDPDFGSSQEKRRKPKRVEKVVNHDVSFHNIARRPSPCLSTPPTSQSRSQPTVAQMPRVASNESHFTDSTRLTSSHILFSPTPELTALQVPPYSRAPFESIENEIESSTANESEDDTEMTMDEMPVTVTSQPPKTQTQARPPISKSLYQPAHRLHTREQPLTFFAEASVRPSHAETMTEIANEIPLLQHEQLNASSTGPQMTPIGRDEDRVSPEGQIGKSARFKTALNSTSLASGPEARSVISPTSRKRRLILIVRKFNGLADMDYENGITYSQFRHSSVSEFFKLFSEKSGESLESLDSLNFTFLFARGNSSMVHRGNDGEWEKLKKRTLVLFSWKSQRKHSRMDYEVVIESGRRVDEDHSQSSEYMSNSE